ncbi:hypothetical protein ElyMa_003503800 [Elysia marginata]|uniref:Uncharacterized protein n=1 Tax=Elysia marginata TaxID=1093978 RepID=A0AAV4EFA0_9GAST|nr:hypothetical protein ElyMa_003503800 [Elysia marginata]
MSTASMSQQVHESVPAAKEATRLADTYFRLIFSCRTTVHKCRHPVMNDVSTRAVLKIPMILTACREPVVTQKNGHAVITAFISRPSLSVLNPTVVVAAVVVLVVAAVVVATAAAAALFHNQYPTHLGYREPPSVYSPV